MGGARGAQCLLRLTVTPARLSGVAEALATDPEAAFVGITTGPDNVSTASAVSTASTAWKQP
ncbi:hypothetical protein AB0L04_09630 [Streptomyces glaucescens]|uniref:hypothetical protein n=1 Tax=Streptomyces glaucescens TaxID=1907 RepID=UPI00344E559E